MTYFCDSGSYLERAQDCLEHEDPRHLFYAAYELRCFVESRQHEYLEAQKKYRRSIPARWKIGRQSSELRRIFRLDKIQRITSIFPDGFVFVSTYVPVSQALKNNAERLGVSLHSQKSDLSAGDIESQKKWLNNIQACANECQAGNMLCPILMDNSTGKAIGQFDLRISAEDNNNLKERFKVGLIVNTRVEYTDFAYTVS